MKKIVLTPYVIQVVSEDGKPSSQSYRVKDSLTAILFNPELKLGYKEIVEADRLSKKIEEAGDFVLLEEAEYVLVKRALDGFKGFRSIDVEFVQRVSNAETVEVAEKK